MPRAESVVRGHLAALAAFVCAASVALAAYASHAAAPGQGERLGLAAAFGFAHGLALLMPLGASRLAQAARILWLLGIVGFCGGLVFAAFTGARAASAPVGGSLLILGWLLLGLHLLRPSSETKA